MAKTRLRHSVLHYSHSDLWDVNICGVRGTWSATGDPKKVTCQRCRRHLTYWVKRDIARRKVEARLARIPAHIHNLPHNRIL